MCFDKTKRVLTTLLLLVMFFVSGCGGIIGRWDSGSASSGEGEDDIAGVDDGIVDVSGGEGGKLFDQLLRLLR